MKSFDPRQVRAGQQVKLKTEESGELIAKEGGAAFALPSKDLDYKNSSRMAGPGGAFAMALADDPELANRVYDWGDAFSTTREGMDFYQLYSDEEPTTSNEGAA